MTSGKIVIRILPLLFIFVITILLIGYVNNFTESGASPGKKEATKIPPRGKAKKIPKKKRIEEKEYKWKNLDDIETTTLFQIDLKNLKKDSDNFGISLKMRNPQYLKRKGFKILGGRIVLDYRGIYRRSLKYFFKHSAGLLGSIEGKKNKDPVSNFLRFVQYINYKIPPRFIKGKYTREFFTPLQCLYNSYGDCDTKSILLAELIGGINSREKFGIVILRGYGIFHAVLAINRKPMPGMKSLFFPGRGYYIPLETTIKNWMPGFLDKRAVNCLEAGFYRFEPLN